ncbi:hypothetical protein GCM10008943_12730 [Paenochrobactrum glaciei]|uniref:Uncharacterized protein n=1 Tax=Paenochrobactrum glaciei TaxID=486407 RepID=A0ABN1FW16_9HYPH
MEEVILTTGAFAAVDALAEAGEAELKFLDVGLSCLLNLDVQFRRCFILHVGIKLNSSLVNYAIKNDVKKAPVKTGAFILIPDYLAGLGFFLKIALRLSNNSILAP